MYVRLRRTSTLTVRERPWAPESRSSDWDLRFRVMLRGAPAAAVQVAIETPHGPVVETLLERGFGVHALNPKQLDRFRDRFTVAGAKDDRRDADVLASSLRTDARAFRRLVPADPFVVELREFSRMADEHARDMRRYVNRMRDQLQRYFPAFLALKGDDDAAWKLALVALAPTPAMAAALPRAKVARLLKAHRVRCHDADQVLAAQQLAVHKDRWMLPAAPGAGKRELSAGDSLRRRRAISRR